jgi:hypothetical protein
MESETAEDHVKHLQIVIDILRWEKLYTSKEKMHQFFPELKLLGHIIDSGRFWMNPDKVNSVLKWTRFFASGSVAELLAKKREHGVRVISAMTFASDSHRRKPWFKSYG